jgi:hypothetical protein
MNAFPKALGFALLIPWCCAAAEPAAGPTPQPRVRLQPEQLVSKVAAEPGQADNVAAVTMDKVTVTESKLPPEPRRNLSPEPTSFSVTTGGPVLKRPLGTSILEFGLWTPMEVFPEDAEYRAMKARADMAVVRIRW